MKWSYKVGLISTWWENPPSSEGNVHFERALYSHLLSDLSTPRRAYADPCGSPLRKYVQGVPSWCIAGPSGSCPQGMAWEQVKKEALCEAREITLLGAGELRHFFLLSFVPTDSHWTHCVGGLVPTQVQRQKVQFPDGTFLLIFQLFTFYVYLRGGFSTGPLLSFFPFLGWKKNHLSPWRWFVRPQNTLGGLYHFLTGKTEPPTH